MYHPNAAFEVYSGESTVLRDCASPVNLAPYRELAVRMIIVAGPVPAAIS